MQVPAAPNLRSRSSVLATPKKRARQVVREIRRELEASAPPPAYFLSLTLENVRSFGPSQTLDLSNGRGRPARWTVILGDNGVGKTTLLQSVAMCTVAEYSSPNESFWYLRAASTGFLLRAARVWNRSNPRPTNRIEIEVFRGAAFGVSDQDSTTIRYFVKREGPMFTSPFLEFGGSAHAADMSTILCCAYGASRRIGSASLSHSDDDDFTASLFSDDVALLNAEEWLLQADYAALVESPQQEQARRRREQVVKVLVDLLPDVTEIRFVRPTSSTSKAGIEVHTPYGWVTIGDLSLGYRALIAWVVDLAYRLFERYPDSPNPLAEPAIVLVDEIDLHLHPRWQRTIMAYLTERFPNTQFIVTAHSPLIVQAATDANIVLLRREGDHVVIDNDVEAIRGWRIDQVLTSDLFGLETARPPEYDGLIEERNRILGKSKLTKKDEQRLRELDARIGDLPTGETPQDMEAMDVIRRAAEVLKRERADLR
ncbi:MAG: AAA family ATPase [Gemmatimonadota bacterium]